GRARALQHGESYGERFELPEGADRLRLLVHRRLRVGGELRVRPYVGRHVRRRAEWSLNHDAPPSAQARKVADALGWSIDQNASRGRPRAWSRMTRFTWPCAVTSTVSPTCAATIRSQTGSTRAASVASDSPPGRSTLHGSTAHCA